MIREGTPPSAKTSERSLHRAVKVLVVSRNNPKKWTPLLNRICSELSSEGMDVHTVGVGYHGEDAKTSESFSRIILRIRRLPKVLHVAGVLWSHLVLVVGLIRLINKMGFRSIIFENVDCAPDIWIINKFFPSIKLVYLSSELAVQRRQLPYRLFERLLAPKLCGIIVNNSYRARILLQRLGVDLKCVVIPNSPSLKDLGVETFHSCRAFFPDISDEEPVVLYQGIVTPERCLLEVVEAIALLERKVRFLIVGAEPERSAYTRRLQCLIKERGLERHVRIVPWVEYGRLLGLTRTADIGILLYRNIDLNHFYCAPNKLFEYMAVGLPCIASDFPEMRNLVEEQGIGKVVNPEHPSAIARAISDLAFRRDLRMQMGKQAQRLFINNYSFDVIWKEQKGALIDWLQ